MGNYSGSKSYYLFASFLSLLIFSNKQANAASSSSGGSMSVGFGVNYNSGGSSNYYPNYGAGVFGYGSGYGSIGAIGGACGGYGSGYPAPILMPAAPAMPGYQSPCQLCAQMRGGKIGRAHV